MSQASFPWPLPFVEPDRNATVTPIGSSHSASDAACCSARISVGAIRAPWNPAVIAA